MLTVVRLQGLWAAQWLKDVEGLDRALFIGPTSRAKRFC
jgi:hypothetical protein